MTITYVTYLKFYFILLSFHQFVINLVCIIRKKKTSGSTVRAVPPSKSFKPHVTETSSDEENIRRPSPPQLAQQSKATRSVHQTCTSRMH